MILMLVSCGVFSYIVSQISEIFRDLNIVPKNIRKDMNIIEQFMQDKKIDSSL